MGKGDEFDKEDIQGNGKSIGLELFYVIYFSILLFLCARLITIVPMDILVLLPPAGWCVDAVAEVMLGDV